MWGLYDAAGQLSNNSRSIKVRRVYTYLRPTAASTTPPLAPRPNQLRSVVGQRGIDHYSGRVYGGHAGHSWHLASVFETVAMLARWRARGGFDLLKTARLLPAARGPVSNLHKPQQARQQSCPLPAGGVPQEPRQCGGSMSTEAPDFCPSPKGQQAESADSRCPDGKT